MGMIDVEKNNLNILYGYKMNFACCQIDKDGYDIEELNGKIKCIVTDNIPTILKNRSTLFIVYYKKQHTDVFTELYHKYTFEAASELNDVVIKDKIINTVNKINNEYRDDAIKIISIYNNITKEVI